jgi:rubrerythrin
MALVVSRTTMAVKARSISMPRRPGRVARRGRTAAGAQAEPPEERARRAGGPEDHALYTCSCGYAFEADVSASVRCPHCGDEQAW